MRQSADTAHVAEDAAEEQGAQDGQARLLARVDQLKARQDELMNE